MGTVGTVAVITLLLAGGVGVASWLGLVAVGASEAMATRRRDRDAARHWVHAASDPALLEQFRGGPFGVGHHAAATDVHRGRHGGRAFVAFDYATTVTGDPEPATRHSYAVVALELGLATCPVSVLRTQSPVPHFQEVDGPEVVVRRAAFPLTHRVRSRDPDLAQALLHPATVDAMLGRPAVAWRLADGWLLAISSVARAPLQVQHELEVLTAMLDGVPPTAWAGFAR